MLEGKTVGRGGVEGRQFGGGQAGVEGGVLACGRSPGTGAVDQRHGVVLQVVRGSACALVGVRHGAAALQGPFAGGNAGVDAARTRGRGRDDARVLCIEAGGHLHHERDISLAGAVVGIGDVFGAWHLAFAGGDVAGRVHVRAVQGAKAARGGHVEHGAVVGVDRGAAQLGGRRSQGVGIRWRQRRSQPGFAQTRGQQIVCAAVVRGLLDRAQKCGLDVRGGVTAPAGRQDRHREGGRNEWMER